MIVEKLEELFALISAQRLLSHAGSSKLSMATVLPPVLTALALAILIDYGYMLYLHFKMVRTEHNYSNQNQHSHQHTATRPSAAPPNRKHTPPPRQQAMDLLRATIKTISIPHNHILDRSTPNPLDLRRLDRQRTPRQTRRNLRLPPTHGRLQ